MDLIKQALAVTALSFFLHSANAGIILADSAGASAHPTGVRSFTHTYDLDGSYQGVSLFFDSEDGYNASYKHVELFLDDNLILDWGGSTYVNSAPNILSLGGAAYKLFGDVSIEQSLWDIVTADNQVTVSWNQYLVGDPWNAGNYVAFNLSGDVTEVAEPSTIILMSAGLGLFSLMGAYRRKRRV